MRHSIHAAITMVASFGLMTACAAVPAQNALPAHTINVGGNAAPSGIDSCINNVLDSMKGTWTMRFSASAKDGTVAHAQGTLAIKPMSDGRWTIMRPDKSGTFRDFSVITNYGDGLLESISVDDSFGTIYEETFLECHAPDASGRSKYVSLMEPSSGPYADTMTITRTGWGTADHHYSFDVIEWANGSYALSTRSGERTGGLPE